MRYVSLAVCLVLLGCASSPKLVVVPPTTAPVEAPEPPPDIPAPPEELALLMATEPGRVPARATGKQVGAMLLYSYQPGQVFPVETAVHQATTILWPVGEEIKHMDGAEAMLAQPDSQEKVPAWAVNPIRSGISPSIREQITITPRAPKLKTNLVVATTRHLYVLELTSTEKRYQPMVGFYSEPVPVARKVSTPPHIRMEGRLGVGYEILAPEGQVPFWVPLQVWDDTRLTVFRFAPGVWAREVPALYSLTAGKEPTRQLVNYRQHGVYLIADRLAQGWELKLGETVVQVRQTEAYAVQQCPGAAGCPAAAQTTAMGDDQVKTDIQFPAAR